MFHIHLHVGHQVFRARAKDRLQAGSNNYHPGSPQGFQFIRTGLAHILNLDSQAGNTGIKAFNI